MEIDVDSKVSEAQTSGPRRKHNRHLQKAYRNARFLNSSDARVLRMLAEYLEPFQRLRKRRVKDTIVFFGSARAIPREQAERQLAAAQAALARGEGEPEQLAAALKAAQNQLYLSKYYEDARELARRLTEWSMSLNENQRFVVCSGGGPGIMEAANRGAAEAGGHTIGMNISLPHEQEPNPWISPGLGFEFHYFFMRKFWFVYLAKALAVFPGGFGTLDEWFEVLTLLQTGKMKKLVPVLAYGREYWEQVINFDKLLEYGVISEKDMELFSFASTVDEAYEFLTTELTQRFLRGRRRKYWYL
ncbi:MAG: TIGR00730 family Rossman fold protein [candidate division KSB1 bacterium]|nr:TIGR00730 family Rossman fold protein [candidate division KSB1 bacterium]